METQGNESVIMSSPDCHGASDMLFPASDSVEKLVHSLQTSGEHRLGEIEKLFAKSLETRHQRIVCSFVIQL